MTRGGGSGGEVGKVVGPLFPRLHVSDAARGSGPRAPPRNKMALYEQFTVPSSRFGSPASARAGVGTLAPAVTASQVSYGYDRPMFQPFSAPSNEPTHLAKKNNEKAINRQISSTRIESGRLSSQTNNYVVYTAPAGSIPEHNSSGKKLANIDKFMVPSICSPRFPEHYTQECAGVQEKSKTLFATSSHKTPPASSKSSAKGYNAVNKHLEKMDVSDIRSRSSLNVKEKQPAQALKSVEVEERRPSIQASKDSFGNKDIELCLKRDKVGNINDLGNSGRQATSMNRSSMKTQNPTTTKDTISCKPYTDLQNTNRNSFLLEESLMEAGVKKKRSLGHHDIDQNGDMSDSSIECIPGWEISPDEIVGAIGPKHFWKARRAIQNQQRVFAVQVFELHKLIKVQKFIAASPHLLIEGDPCLGNALVGKKNKSPSGNLKVQTLPIADKDDIQPSLEQPELSKENTEGNPPSPSCGYGIANNHHDQAASNGAFTSNTPAMSAAPDNTHNNWCMNPPQNQWLVPVMSPSEGLVYKPYTGPCPPPGSLLAPVYGNCIPLTLPSTAFGIPMSHQTQHMAPPSAPAMPTNMNYFPPFSLPVVNPMAPTSAVGHLASFQPNGSVEQQSRVSCNMSNPSGISRFHASRDSEAQASSATSPFDMLQGQVSFFPAASVQNAPPQPSSGCRDKQTHVIRVVPHNAQTASESAARIFRSIQMGRQQNDL